MKDTHTQNSQLVLGRLFQLGRCLFVLLDQSCVAFDPRLFFLLMCGLIAYVQACTCMPKLSEYVSVDIVMLMNRGIKPLSMSYCLMQKKRS